MFNVTFWGTRGSIPIAPNRENIKNRLEQAIRIAVEQKLDKSDDIVSFIDSLPFHIRDTYGGNSSCVELDAGQNEYILCDLGTGIRDFAARYLSSPETRKSNVFHMFMSHLHWDHIMGFPFFPPAYMPGHKIKIYGCHSNMEESFRRQHSDPNFPVDFSTLLADIEFIKVPVGEVFELQGFKIEARLQLHEGDSYGFKFTRDGKTVVYSTDSEHKVENQQDLSEFSEFIRGADLVIFDAMYSLLEAITLKEDWGHSSNLMGVELCLRGEAKSLCLFHHDPLHSDQQIESSVEEALDFLNVIANGKQLKVFAAYDGQQVSV